MASEDETRRYAQDELRELFLGPVAHRKTATVLARLAIPGETVVTTVGGRIECQRRAEAGDVVVTGPSGELYAIPAAVFLGRHEGPPLDGEDREHVATGLVHAVPWTRGPAALDVSWAGGVVIEDGDMLCALDPEGLTGLYRIERGAFALSFRPEA